MDKNSTTTAGYQQHHDHVLDEKHIMLDNFCIFIFFTWMIFIISGNILVLVAMKKNKRLRSSTHVLIGSLAVADLVVGLLGTPTFSAGHHFNIGLDKNYYICLLGYLFPHLSTGVSMLTMLAISIERYLAVKYPMWHQQTVTPKKMMAAVIFIWLYASISITLLLTLTSKWVENESICNFGDVTSGLYKILLLSHGIAVLIIATTLHTLVSRMANKHRKRVLEMNHHMSEHSRMQADIKTARMLAMVLGLFYFCWVPYLLTMPAIFLFKPRDTMGDPFWLHCWETIGGIILLSNSFMNPIVYAWQNKTFRNTFRRLLRLRTHKDQYNKSSSGPFVSPFSSQQNSPLPSARSFHVDSARNTPRSSRKQSSTKFTFTNEPIVINNDNIVEENGNATNDSKKIPLNYMQLKKNDLT